MVSLVDDSQSGLRASFIISTRSWVTISTRSGLSNEFIAYFILYSQTIVIIAKNIFDVSQPYGCQWSEGDIAKIKKLQVLDK